MARKIELTRMDFEVPARDSRGRPSYQWRTGYLAKGPDGRDLYPPTSWSEARELTLRHHPGANVTKGA